MEYRGEPVDSMSPPSESSDEEAFEEDDDDEEDYFFKESIESNSRSLLDLVLAEAKKDDDDPEKCSNPSGTSRAKKEKKQEKVKSPKIEKKPSPQKEEAVPVVQESPAQESVTNVSEEVSPPPSPNLKTGLLFRMKDTKGIKKVWKPYWCELRSKCLYFFSPRDHSQAEGLLRLHECIKVYVTPLEQCHEANKFSFEIVTSTQSSYCFYSTLEEDQIEWGRAISRALDISSESPPLDSRTRSGSFSARGRELFSNKSTQAFAGVKSAGNRLGKLYRTSSMASSFSTFVDAQRKKSGEAPLTKDPATPEATRVVVYEKSLAEDFEKFMDNLNIKEGAERERLKALPNSKKIVLLQQQGSSKASPVKESSPIVKPKEEKRDATIESNAPSPRAQKGPQEKLANDANSMQSKALLEQKLEALLNEQSISDKQREAMMALPDELKWSLVLQNETKLKKDETETELLYRRTKEQLEEVLKNPKQLLDLSGKRLVHLPSFVADELSHCLTQLDLGFNFITKFPDFSRLPKLEHLTLSGNRLREIPSTVSYLSGLRELDMTGNKIEKVSDQLQTLKFLEKLVLANNRLEELPPLDALVHLEELVLNGNPLKQIPPSIGALTALHTVDFSFCKLTQLPDEFATMGNVIEVDLSDNKLEELPWNMGRLTRLTSLKLAGNKLKGLPLSMGYCKSLGSLGSGIRLENNPIESEEMLKKYKIGVDHLLDFLEKRLATSSNAPTWQQLLTNQKELSVESDEEDEEEQDEKQEVGKDAGPIGDMKVKMQTLMDWGVQYTEDLKKRILAFKYQLDEADHVTSLTARIKEIHQELYDKKNILSLGRRDCISPPDSFGDSTEDAKNCIYECNRALTAFSRELSSKNPYQDQMEVLSIIKVLKACAALLA